jgi:putative transposase
MSEQTERKSYPTDLTDAEWQQIARYLPERKSPRGRRRVHAYREIVNAIFYVLRSGCSWRMLPHDLPPWQTVYHSFVYGDKTEAGLASTMPSGRSCGWRRGES